MRKILIIFTLLLSNIYVFGESRLFKAIKKNNLEKIKILVNKGEDINKKNHKKITALEYSVLNNSNSETIKLLIDLGAEPLGKILPILAEEDRFDILDYAYKKTSDLNVRDSDGNTVLQILAKKRNVNPRIIENLIEKGADPLIKNNSGSTLLHSRAYLDIEKDETTLRILDAGVNINELNNVGLTALSIAINNRNDYLIDFLLKSGANPNFGEIDNLSNLDFCVSHDLYSTFKKLIKEGAKLTNKTAFFAVDSYNTNYLLTIFDMGIDINQNDNEGNTLLMHAAERRREKALTFLIEKGANINLKNNNGDSALSIVAASNDFNYEINNILIKNGVEGNSKNSKGLSPIMIANIHGNNSLAWQYNEAGFILTENDREITEKLIIEKKIIEKKMASKEARKREKENALSSYLVGIGKSDVRGHLLYDYSTISDIDYTSSNYWSTSGTAYGWGILCDIPDVTPYFHVSEGSFGPFAMTGKVKIGYSVLGKSVIGFSGTLTFMALKMESGINTIKGKNGKETIFYTSFGAGM